MCNIKDEIAEKVEDLIDECKIGGSPAVKAAVIGSIAVAAAAAAVGIICITKHAKKTVTK